MSDLITYDDKIRLKSQNVSEKYKVTAGDMNEIKSVVNTNAEEVGDTTSLTTTDKTNVVNAINELNTPEKWVSVGAEAPENGERVWFSKGKNLFNKNTTNILNAKIKSNNTITSDNNERMIFVECKPNTTYTLSKLISSPIRNSIGTTQVLPTIGVAIENAVYSATSPKTITTNANAKYIVWLVYSINDTTNTLQQMLESMQIEEGSTATTYEPYVKPAIYVDGMKIYEMS